MPPWTSKHALAISFSLLTKNWKLSQKKFFESFPPPFWKGIRLFELLEGFVQNLSLNLSAKFKSLCTTLGKVVKSLCYPQPVLLGTAMHPFRLSCTEGFQIEKNIKIFFSLENCSIGPTKTIHILIYTDLQNLLCLLYSTNKYILASQIYT